MSTSFWINNAKDLGYHDMIRRVSEKDLRLKEETELGGSLQWPEGQLHFYIDNLSCRPIEITYDGDLFQIRILQASSIADYELALKFVVAAAEATEGTIDTENEGRLTLNAFQKKYDLKWCQAHMQRMLEMLIEMYEHKSSRITLSGCKCDLKIGPRFMNQVLQDPENFSKNFFERFRRLQYLENEDIFIAAVITVSDKENPYKEAKVAVLAEAVATALSISADVIAIRNQEGHYLNLRTDEFINLLGEDAFWLSEELLITKSYQGRDFEQLWSKAESLALPIEQCYVDKTTDREHLE